MSNEVNNNAQELNEVNVVNQETKEGEELSIPQQIADSVYQPKNQVEKIQLFIFVRTKFYNSHRVK